MVCTKIKLKEKQNIQEFIKKLKTHCKKSLEKYKIPIKIIVNEENLHGYRYKKFRKNSDGK